MVEDFGLLSFQPLAIEDVASVRHLAALVDKSNGYVFAGLAQQGARAPRVRFGWVVPRLLRLLKVVGWKPYARTLCRPGRP